MKERTKKAIEDLSRSWASRVITALLCDFESGRANLPPDVVMKGVNMVEKDNGTFVVGFVFAREGA
ncbi:MAG: hypothetical protein IIY63_04225 [Oscillospiraceae bacterium]|nr:hypothetical protein [Oscillospiraceae bacterium]